MYLIREYRQHGKSRLVLASEYLEKILRKGHSADDKELAEAGMYGRRLTRRFVKQYDKIRVPERHLLSLCTLTRGYYFGTGELLIEPQMNKRMDM